MSLAVPSQAQKDFAAICDVLDKRNKANRMLLYYPDEDRMDENGVVFPARRKYPKHLEMFRRGADVFARMFRAGNGCGKSELSLFELICQMRGWYPHWWEGRRFDGPIDAWICGQSSETVRSIQQLKMLGHPKHEGTGMLPAEWLDFGSITRSGVPGAIDTFGVRHVSGKLSHGQFKSYKQGVESFFGPEKHVILMDELPPSAIYSECVARTRNRPGAYVMVTCSPKKGNTETVKLFHEKPDPSRIVIPCGWVDTPHLSEEWKAKTRANTPRYLIPATEFGEVGRGAGAVYEVLEEDIVVEPFQIPKHFRWLYAMDGGYHNTACIWIAYDKDNNKAYIVDEYKAGGEGTDVSIHAARFTAKNRDRGFEKMPGVGDVAAISQTNGDKLLTEYRRYGLNLTLASKGVDANIGRVRAWLGGGQLKVFKTCLKWLDEFRNYSYEVDDEGNTGKIVKLNDHLMDCTQYAIAGIEKADTPRKSGSSFQEHSVGH